MIKDLYESMIEVSGQSVFNEPSTDRIPIADLPQIPILTAFLEDDDIQEITVCSSNIGMVRTFRKIYKAAKKPKIGPMKRV